MASTRGADGGGQRGFRLPPVTSPVVIAPAAVIGVAGTVGLVIATRRFQRGVSTPKAIEGVRVLANPRVSVMERLGGIKWAIPEGALFGADGVPEAAHAVRPETTPTVTQRARHRIRVELHNTMVRALAPIGGRGLLEHVDQGALGDCWAIAAMGAKALKQPEHVLGMVIDPVVDTAKLKAAAEQAPELKGLLNASDKVRAQLRDYVVITGPDGASLMHRSIPMKGDHPAYAANNGEALWPAYLEKKLAATSGGSYKSIAGGWPRNAFASLFGDAEAVTQVRTPQPALLNIKQQLEAGTPVTFTTLDGATGSGLHGNHTYVAEEVTGTGEAMQMKAFNPWGEEHPELIDEAALAANTQTAESTRYWYNTPAP